MYDTRLKRGRALWKSGKEEDFTLKSHPKITKSVVFKGQHTPGISKEELKVRP